MNRFSRSQAAIIILLSLLLLTFYGWRHYFHNRQSGESSHFLPPEFIIQVSGEVRNPGIYSFDPPVTVNETVAGAGGLLPQLDPEPGWTRVEVAHASRVHITATGDGFARLRLGWMDVSSRLALGVPLDLNQASAAELAQVPGITQTLAKRIVEQRTRLGGFSTLEDLRAVKGIGPVTLKRLQPYLIVNATGRRGEGEKRRNGDIS
jgi:competence protein ComEA